MRSGKLEAAGGYQFLRKVTMSFLNVMLLCCSSHLSTEQFSSMFPNVSTCVSVAPLISAQSSLVQCFQMYQRVSHCCSIFLVTVNSSSALSHFPASASQNLNEEKCIVLTSYCSSSGREEQIVFEALEDLTILCRGH